MKIKLHIEFSLLLITLIHTPAFTQEDSILVNFKFISDTAHTVSIAGSFNNWTPNNFDLSNISGMWTKSIKLKPGYYYYKLVVDGNWIPDPDNSDKINDGGESYNSIIKVGEPPTPKRQKNLDPFPKDQLPQPILSDDPRLVELYYSAWEMAWNKIKKGSTESGFTKEFMDEGFNEMIYQWDTSFMMFFGFYGKNVFPVMQSLDNFYNHQEPDGYIQRVYNEVTGEKAAVPTSDDPMVNPPIFSWIELEYYKSTGDNSRLRRVLPILVKYFNWIDKNCKTSLGKGLYYTSHLGSGMDNTPRFNIEKAGWIDFSSQQAFSAKSIFEIALIINEKDIASEFQNKYFEIKNLVNKLCWSNEKKFYFDLTRNDTLCNTYHIGAYWTLISDIANENQTDDLINILTDTLHFWRKNLIPTLSYSDQYYNSSGHYWRGSVWAPTNYMVIKGLQQKGHKNLADSIAQNHLNTVAEVYYNFTLNKNNIAYEERYDDGYKTIWECYSPEYYKPATRWDNTFYSRQDFVGWSGLGPIALLIENILGFKVVGFENKIVWNIHRTDFHGIKNLLLKDQKVSLLFYEDEKIEIKSQKPFTLKVFWKNKELNFNISKQDEIFILNKY